MNNDIMSRTARLLSRERPKPETVIPLGVALAKMGACKYVNCVKFVLHHMLLLNQKP